MKRILYLLILSVILPCTIQAQSFTDRSTLLADRDMHSAVPIAIADMNGDGLDDIVSMNGGTELFIQYQTPDEARPFVRYKAPVDIDIDAQNDIIIADFNNDGANDIFTVGSYDRVKVLYAVPHTFEFNLVYITVTPFFSQGATSGDFNGDGWIDVVMLNDNGLNYSMMNDGAGNLVKQDFFNFVTIPASDNSGNYGSVYTDFDMDGDNDFYIAKCRQGVNNPNDPRRINALWVNDGANNYTQDAANFGLASGNQTWTADFGDMDNDGDMDCFMTQHNTVSELFENINNDTFINITLASGLNIGGVPLQGMFRDFDNDGFQDILVSGDRLDYYHNDGDKTFTKLDPFAGEIFGTFALGDLNHDGFTDIYGSTVRPFNNPDLQKQDILYLNDGNDNHFLSLNLMDVNNRNAIGAIASLYGSWGVQVRDVKAGEQYGVSNSHGMIFGLGEETNYDSLVVRWADGSRETFTDLDVDQTWRIDQQGCQNVKVKLFDELVALCDDDSLVLNADIHQVLQWSTGETSDAIVVKEAGLYFLTFLDDENCLSVSLPVEVIKDPDSVKPVIVYEGNTLLCNGEIAQLSVTSGNGYLWSTGSDAQTIEVTGSGEYFVFVDGYCKTQSSDTLQLEYLVPELPVTQQDTFAEGEAATLFAVGDSIVWYDSNGNQVGTGSSLIVNDLVTSTTFFAYNLSPIPGLTFHVGPTDQAGNTKYNAAFVNGGLLFDVLQPIVLEGLTLFTDSAGVRIIEITGNSYFFEHEVDLVPGENQVSFYADLPVGTYTISTNNDQNLQTFGDVSPILWRSSDGVNYPYDINNVVSITNSTFGEDFYYYFYDWIVSTADQYCSSDPVAVTAFLDIEVATSDPDEEQYILISPNPTDGVTQLTITSSFPADIIVSAVDGTIIQQNKMDAGVTSITFDLSAYPAGTYILQAVRNEQIITRKIIKL